MAENKCKKCGKKLTNPVSIERGYGNTCFRSIQLQKSNETEINSEVNQEIAFLKCEIKTLKRMIRNIQVNGIKTETIKRIKREEQRPERNTNKGNMVGLVEEMKIIFTEGFNYRDILSPVNGREIIELPPVMMVGV